MRTADADDGRRTADDGRRTADYQIINNTSNNRRLERAFDVTRVFILCKLVRNYVLTKMC